jgi:sec-independent protein translocase protein TatA
MPGGSEWFVILIIALLLFGKKLPEVARSMGKSVNEFKKGLNNIEDDIHKPPENPSENTKNTSENTKKEAP